MKTVKFIGVAPILFRFSSLSAKEGASIKMRQDRELFFPRRRPKYGNN